MGQVPVQRRHLVFFDSILEVCEGCLLRGSRGKTQAEDALCDCEVGVLRKLRLGTHDERRAGSWERFGAGGLWSFDGGNIESSYERGMSARGSRSLRITLPKCHAFRIAAASCVNRFTLTSIVPSFPNRQVALRYAAPTESQGRNEQQQ